MKHNDELVPTYREYKGLSGFKQSRYKKHFWEIEDFEQTRDFLKEQCRAYTIDDKLPSLCDMEKLLQRMKDRRDEILHEHKAYFAKKQVAHQYTKAVRRYRNQQINKRAAKHSKYKKFTQQRKTHLNENMFFGERKCLSEPTVIIMEKVYHEATNAPWAFRERFAT